MDGTEFAVGSRIQVVSELSPWRGAKGRIVSEEKGIGIWRCAIQSAVGEIQVFLPVEGIALDDPGGKA